MLISINSQAASAQQAEFYLDAMFLWAQMRYMGNKFFFLIM